MPTQDELRRKAAREAQLAKKQQQQLEAVAQQQAAQHSQSVQKKAKATADAIRSQQGLGTVGQNLGEPMDYTQGTPLGNNPPPLPSLDEQPGGIGVRAPTVNPLANMADPGSGELTDDHEEIMRQIAAEGGKTNINPPPPRTIPHIPRYKEPDREEHPVLQALKRDLGIDDVPMEDVKVGKHTWTLAVLDQRDTQIIQRIADTFSETSTEYELVWRTACVSQSIRAIDQVPAYEVWGISVPPGMDIQDPLNPPRDLRISTSFETYKFISENTKAGLSNALYDAFLDKLDKYSEVQSYLTDVDKPRYRYACTQKGCKHEEVMWPRYVEGSTEHLPVYCKYHGSAMAPIARVVGGEDLPLP